MYALRETAVASAAKMVKKGSRSKRSGRKSERRGSILLAG